MSCQVEQIADCGDISSLARALFIPEREDENWLSQCCISLSSCGNLLAVGNKNRLCLLISQWISSSSSNTFLISWSGTVPADITGLLALSICSSQQSSQNSPDWFCVVVGLKNGSVGFYSNTGHLLLMEKLDDKPVMKISCHTGTYGTMPDDIHVLFPNCVYIISGTTLFPTLRNAKSQLAKVRAGLHEEFSVDSHDISIRKWLFSEQEIVNDAAVVGLELKNAYDHLLAASTYAGYDVWYRSVPPVNTLILSSGQKPYVGFHYALEGGTTPPLQDVARAVANKIKSALPGWLGGASTDNTSVSTEPQIKSEALSMRSGLYDMQRFGSLVEISPDRRLAAFVDNFGRVAILDVNKGYLIRLFKGCRDAQCAFVQIFEVDEKKPQLSVIKEIKRAIFLIIYNPKKGIIDIRLMQTGNRVAVFTATKNGLLIYNSCGLVGAEKNYTYKKLNLPEFQCVLIDPDGKLKRFNIPFFFALEGEHSERSKDLHTLRELREFVKKSSVTNEFYEEELLKKASDIKTLELKRHFLDMLIKNYDTPPKIVLSCLNIFWEGTSEENFDMQQLEIKHYFAKLGLITLFYRLINNDTTDDTRELIEKLQKFLELDLNIDISSKNQSKKEKEENKTYFHLLEDDSCILERLLALAQENDYKEQLHARVTFADTNTSKLKEFISCFVLDGKSKHICLKQGTSMEKLNNMAAITFKSILKLNNFKMLRNYVRECNVDPTDIVKLLIMQIMNMSIEELNIELIEKFIIVLYNICSVSVEACNIIYNEISPWWENIRQMLVEMPCPLRSMIVAMACKAVSKIFEFEFLEGEEDIWESVTKENAKWGILIGKLEDISILSIVLMYKGTFRGEALPKLQTTDYNINLKYIYNRGKGSVTELIAKWLCGMGVTPEVIITNELMEIQAAETASNPTDANEDNDSNYLLIENNIENVNENPEIFKWISLLRRQFPLSTSACYIIANMCWEYSIAWQKSMQNISLLETVIHCLMNISNIPIRLGLFSIIWSTYIKHVFEVSCRLVNKVGRQPKDPLCLQDVGFDSITMVDFLKVTVNYLSNFQTIAINVPVNHKKEIIQFEKIWDESLPSLVEVAQHTKHVNVDILNLNYQISCTIYYQCHFNIKFSKPLDTLYDIDYQYIFEALTGNVLNRDINMKPSEKLRNPRMKFLTKLIRASIETISIIDNTELYKRYNSEECDIWIDKISTLAELWSVEVEFIKRQQVVALYHMAYDTLAENIIGNVKEPAMLLTPILAITIQRLKRSLEHSPNQPEWIVTVPPHLYKRLQNTDLDTSIPAYSSLATTILVLQKLLLQVDKKTPDSSLNTQNLKLIELIIENCEVLLRRKL